MTTIKNPKTVSHARGNGNGLTAVLLLLTWVALGAGIYAVKQGILQPDTASPAVSESLTALDTKVTLLEARLEVLEKKLSAASAALNPVVTPGAATGATSPVPGVSPNAQPDQNEEKKTEDGAANPSGHEPLVSEPEDGGVAPQDIITPEKPHTDNGSQDRISGSAAISEKKSYSLKN